MRQTGTANLPLHTGHCPPWLFKKMKKLAKTISDMIIYEYGQKEYLKRLSDPYFFQSLGCVLGFDWHSSGLTTTVCGALKESIIPEEHGIFVAGGKGRASHKSPEEITKPGFSLTDNKIESLKYASKLSAKVDNSLVQDNYNLYHHVFIFSEKGEWTTIQQGMNPENRYARRYHWLSGTPGFIEEPHTGISCDRKEKSVLDLTSKKSRDTRKTILDLINDNPEHIKKLFLPKNQSSLSDFSQKKLDMPASHHIPKLNNSSISTLKKAYELQPKDYEELVRLKGMGPKTMRALALVSDLVYGSESSWKDPAKYSFAHGGKDGIPYPVNKSTYKKSMETLKDAVQQAKIKRKDKLEALKKLNNFI